MKRYAVIVTEHTGDTDSPHNCIHWLKKGTVVEIISEGEVRCVAPCYGVEIAQFTKRNHTQHINPEDIVEIDGEQVEGLARAWFAENLYK